MRRHAGAGVGHRNTEVIAGRGAGHLALGQNLPRDLQGDGAAGRRRVGGVDHQIEHRALELGGVHPRSADIDRRDHLQLHRLVDRPSQQGLGTAQQAGKVDGLQLQLLAAGEGQQLAGQALTAPSGFQRRLAVAHDPRGVGRFAQDHVQLADHHRQQVVEVVGDAAGQPPDRLQALGLRQGRLRAGAVLQALFQLAAARLEAGLKIAPGLDQFRDVGADAEPALNGARLVADRLAANLEPAQGAIVPAQAVLHVVATVLLGMQRLQPAGSEVLLLRHARVGAPLRAEIVDQASGVSRPDQLRRHLGQGAELSLRAADRLGRGALAGDVPERGGDAIAEAHRAGAQSPICAAAFPIELDVVGPIAGQHRLQPRHHPRPRFIGEHLEHTAADQG